MYWATPCKEKEALKRRGINGDRSGLKLLPAFCRPFYLPQAGDSQRSALGLTWDRDKVSFPRICAQNVFWTCLFLLVLVFRDITWGKLPFFSSLAFVKAFWFLPSYKRVLEAPSLKRCFIDTIKIVLTPDRPLNRPCIQWSKVSQWVVSWSDYRSKKTLLPISIMVGWKVWKAPNKTIGSLEKQPKTKASLPKTKGPTSSICWHSLSERLQFRIGLLKSGSHASTISQCNSDLSGSEPSHPGPGPAQPMRQCEQKTHISVSPFLTAVDLTWEVCCGAAYFSAGGLFASPPPPPCAFYFMVSKWISYHILS